MLSCSPAVLQGIILVPLTKLFPALLSFLFTQHEFPIVTTTQCTVSIVCSQCFAHFIAFGRYSTHMRITGASYWLCGWNLVFGKLCSLKDCEWKMKMSSCSSSGIHFGRKTWCSPHIFAHCELKKVPQFMGLNLPSVILLFLLWEFWTGYVW